MFTVITLPFTAHSVCFTDRSLSSLCNVRGKLIFESSNGVTRVVCTCICVCRCSFVHSEIWKALHYLFVLWERLQRLVKAESNSINIYVVCLAISVPIISQKKGRKVFLGWSLWSGQSTDVKHTSAVEATTQEETSDLWGFTHQRLMVCREGFWKEKQRNFGP